MDAKVLYICEICENLTRYFAYISKNDYLCNQIKNLKQT